MSKLFSVLIFYVGCSEDQPLDIQQGDSTADDRPAPIDLQYGSAAQGGGNVVTNITKTYMNVLFKVGCPYLVGELWMQMLLSKSLYL